MTSFSSLNLAEPLDRALRDLGHNAPTPIQSQAIPDAMNGRDIMGIAQTGTGKTAAFTLPTLHHLFTHKKDAPKRGARVLILAPTRELADQIAVSVRDYGRHMEDLTVACIYGGVPINRQIKRLVFGNDVIVATPGRLKDLLDRKAMRIDEVEVLILDEADQMMDMGFIHALKKIIPLLPKKRQTLFFSATLAPAIKKLSQQFLTDPIHISVTPANTTAEKVEQRVYHVDQSEKQDLLSVSLLDEAVKRALVFTRTKHGADRVVKRLAKVGILAVAIHGNKSQGQRTRALEDYRSGKVNVLIATDIAARGIDIPDITHVFNFEIPNVPEQYVHRIGRTARAEKSGIAIALVDKTENNYLRDIEKLLKEKLPKMDMPDEMAATLKTLQSRTPLPAPPPPQPDARKGRGKSKKKARFSKSDKPSEKASGERSSRQGGGGPRNNSKKRDDNAPRLEGQNEGQRPAKKSWSNNDSSERSRRPKHRTDRADGSESSRSDRPRSDRTRSDKPRSDRPQNDRSKSDKPKSERPRSEPRAEPSAEGRKAQSYSGKAYRGKATGSKPSGKPKEGRPHSGSKTVKPSRAKRKADRKDSGKTKPR